MNLTVRMTGGLIAVVLVLWTSDTVRACGPGVHMDQADLAFEMILEQNPEWQTVWNSVLDPQTYLRLGSVSPDLQNALDTLPWGHGPQISYCLMDRAAETEDPRLILLTLGHLSHNAADPACEAFIQNAIISSVPVGMVNLFSGYDDVQKGETEGVFETYGDLLLGDWEAVVDVLYDLWLESPEAKDEMRELVLWYCINGRECAYQTGTNCEDVMAEFESTLAVADEYIGGMTRGQAHSLINTLISQPLDDLLVFAMEGLLEDFLGAEQGSVSDEVLAELHRLKNGPLAQESFWNPYTQTVLNELCATFTRDFLALKPQAPGFPSWNAEAMASGNLLSLYQFANDDFQVTPGLLVDRVDWLDEGELHAGMAQTSDEGKTFYVRVRFFAALPFQGTITAKVRKDRPGFDTSEDPVVGQISDIYDLDPRDYPFEPRQQLQVPFEVDLENTQGFYLELYVDDSPLPHYSTNLDELWTCGNLNVHRPVIYNLFASYFTFPGSLMAEVELPEYSALLVRAAAKPLDTGIPGASFTFEDELLPSSQGASNGTAVYDLIQPGTFTIHVEADGFFPATIEAFEVGLGEKAFAASYLDGKVDFTQTSQFSASPLQIHWNIEHFRPHVKSMQGRLLISNTEDELVAWTELTMDQPWEVDLDGLVEDRDEIQAELLPRYVDETLGQTTRSATILVDFSEPEVEIIDIVQVNPPECVPELPYRPAMEVSVLITDLQTPMVGIEWSLDQGETWTPLPMDEPYPEGENELVLEFPEANDGATSLWVRCHNMAGLMSTPAETAIPVTGEDDICTIDDPVGPESGEEDIQEQPDGNEIVEQPGPTYTDWETDQDVLQEGTSSSSSASGCSTGTPANPWVVFWLLTVLGVLRRLSAYGLPVGGIEGDIGAHGIPPVEKWRGACFRVRS